MKIKNNILVRLRSQLVGAASNAVTITAPAYTFILICAVDVVRSAFVNTSLLIIVSVQNECNNVHFILVANIETKRSHPDIHCHNSTNDHPIS